MAARYMVVLAAVTAGAAVKAAESALDFSRLTQQVAISYKTGETRPYVKEAIEALHIRQIQETLRTLPDDVKKPAVKDLICKTCTFMVNQIINEFYSGVPVAEIEEQAIQICVAFNLYAEEVCRGTIFLAAPSIVEVLMRRNVTGDHVCSYVIGGRCGAFSWPEWQVEMPDTPKPPHVEPVLPEPSDTTTMQILHLSDLHVDLDYAAGSRADCDMPMCCRAELGPGPNGTAGPYGGLAHCDIPMKTARAMLEWVVARHPDVDVIYVTGDMPAHDIWNQSHSANLRSIQETLRVVQHYFPDTPVFTSIGNHAPCFINLYPPESTMSATNNISWLTSTLSEVWPAMFDTAVSEGTIERGSYYSSRLIPGKLRVISINSNFCNGGNWWLILDSVDPSGQLQWLANQLQEAEDMGEKVHLLSHIPSGLHCLPAWSHQLSRIVNRYEDTIAAQFYGHTHKDEFEVYYDLEDSTRAVSVAYIAPAVTTYSFLNPSYRVFTVDTNTTWMALDYDTYTMNLTLANTKGVINFRHLYSARKDLLEAPLTPRNYDALVQRMKTDRTKFEQYMRFYYHSEKAQAEAGPCVGECRESRICAAETSDTSRLRC